MHVSFDSTEYPLKAAIFIKAAMLAALATGCSRTFVS
jgi:hypothetical protein